MVLFPRCSQIQTSAPVWAWSAWHPRSQMLLLLRWCSSQHLFARNRVRLGLFTPTTAVFLIGQHVSTSVCSEQVAFNTLSPHIIQSLQDTAAMAAAAAASFAPFTVAVCTFNHLKVTQSSSVCVLLSGSSPLSHELTPPADDGALCLWSSRPSARHHRLTRCTPPPHPSLQYYLHPSGILHVAHSSVQCWNMAECADKWRQRRPPGIHRARSSAHQLKTVKGGLRRG